MTRRLRSILAAAVLLGFAVTPAGARVTILFDGSGVENGVTEPGTRDFSFMGSQWTGGIVETERITPLYASGSFSYEIQAGGGAVTFDNPIESVRFFFVHGFGFAPGSATAFDAPNAVIASADSRQATFFGDRNNFVTLDADTPIARVELSAGVVDNFTFVLAAAPGATETPTPTSTPAKAATGTPTATARPLPCVGDCNEDGMVTVNELITGVNIALGSTSLAGCGQFDFSGNGELTIDELVAAVNAALRGCEAR